MGGAVTTIAANDANNQQPISSLDSFINESLKSKGNVNNANKRLNQQIFELPTTEAFDQPATQTEMDANTVKLLTNALSGFDFLQTAADEFNPKMEMLMHAMQREEFEAGYVLIVEGRIHI